MTSVMRPVSVKIRRTLRVALPEGGGGEGEGLGLVERDHRRQTPLREQREGAEQHDAAHQMRQREGQVHPPILAATNRNTPASTPSSIATPKNSGTRNTRIFAVEISNTGKAAGHDGEFDAPEHQPERAR